MRHSPTQRRVQHDLPQQIDAQQGYIDKYKSDLIHLQDTRGDKFKIKLLNKSYTKREEAGKIIHGIVSKITMSDKHFKDVIGSFAGFEIEAFCLGNRVDPELRFKGESKALYCSLNTALTPLGTIQSIERKIAKLPNELDGAQSYLSDLNQRLQQLQSETDKPFDYQQELESLLVRQQEINSELGLNKDDEQAAVQNQDSEEIQSDQQEPQVEEESENSLDLESLGIDTNWDWKSELEEIGFTNCSSLCEPDPQLIERLQEIYAGNQHSEVESAAPPLQQGEVPEPIPSQVNQEIEKSVQRLRQWYGLADHLERPYLNRIKEIAHQVKAGQPIPEKAHKAMESDIKDYNQRIDRLLTDAKKIVNHLGKPSATGAKVYSGKNYMVSENKGDNLSIQAQDRGLILQLEQGKMNTLKMRMADFKAFSKFAQQAGQALTHKMQQGTRR